MFDHLLLQGRFAGVGVLTIEVAGRRPAETTFRLEAVGETGTLTMRGGAMRGFQACRVSLLLKGETQHVDEGELSRSPTAPPMSPAFTPPCGTTSREAPTPRRTSSTQCGLRA